MPIGTLVEVHHQDGRPVLTKTATNPAARDRLEREADRLRTAGHPGVVELLERAEDPELRITLAWAGVRTLETLHPSVPVAAAVLASLAETVADLHALGIVHGRIDASHVIVDGEGRPRLCGFAGADDPDIGPSDDVAAVGRLIDLMVGVEAELEPIPDRRWSRRRWSGYARRALQTLADQATDPEPDHRPTARGLARAIAEAIPEAHLAAPEAVQELNPSASDLRASVGDGRPAPSEPVMAVDCEPDPSDGVVAPEDESSPDATVSETPTTSHEVAWPAPARTFLGMRVLDRGGDEDRGEGHGHVAASSEEAEPGGGPGLRRPAGQRPLHDRPVGGPAGRLRRNVAGVPAERLAVAAAILVVILLMAVVGLRLQDRPGVATTTATSTGEAAAPTPSFVPSSTVPTTVSSTGRSPCPPVTGPAVALDGADCAQAVRVDGTVVQVGAARFRLGRSGDRVAVGDWNCDGRPTPAVVRPSTGEVFVFSTWATAGQDLTIAPAAVVAGATTPTNPEPDACGPLRVRRGNGTEAIVPIPRSGR